MTGSTSGFEPLPPPARALAIGAHPDDIEFGVGGTLAAWADRGCDITMVVMTDGSKGTWDEGTDPTALARTRRSEQDQAAAALGAGRVVFLDHADGDLEYTMGLREQVARQIRLHRPEVVVSHDPWRPYEIHPDHRATGWAVVDGVVAARDHLYFPHHTDDGLGAHRPDWLLLWRPATADHWEDIFPTFDRKLAALLCHVSQGATTMNGAPTGEEARQRFRARLAEHAADQGREVGLELAEAFKRIRP